MVRLTIDIAIRRTDTQLCLNRWPFAIWLILLAMRGENLKVSISGWDFVYA